MSGNKQAFNFEPTDTILQIKQALQEKEGIEIPMIRLIFGGKQLVDESKISDYKLEAGSTIHMVLQLRGGCWFPCQMTQCVSRIWELEFLKNIDTWGISSIITIHNIFVIRF